MAEPYKTLDKKVNPYTHFPVWRGGEVVPNTTTVDTGQYLNATLMQPDRPEKSGTNKKIHSTKYRGVCYLSMLLRHKKGHVLLPIRLIYRN